MWKLNSNEIGNQRFETAEAFGVLRQSRSTPKASPIPKVPVNAI
jgi:hypothetical protein